jgi:hypothetical protein
MNGKRYSSILFGLLAVSLIVFGIPLKASAYHSGSESDLAANPELITFRNFGAGSADNTLALNPELAFSRSFSVSGSPVLKVDSVRWSALGFYYAQKMAMLRGAEADSARWVAMGDKLMARGRDVDSARWVALGASYGASIVFNPELILSRSYDDLASNPELLSLQKYETCGC